MPGSTQVVGVNGSIIIQPLQAHLNIDSLISVPISAHIWFGY